MALHVEVTPATQETPGKIKNPLAETLLLNIEIDTACLLSKRNSTSVFFVI
jgi:hypothetical protein